MPRLKASLVLLSLATACVPAHLLAQNTYRAVPGSLNFVQGQANIDGQPLDINSSTTPNRQLKAGETLATANGSADLLLAPGALLRIGENTTVQMVAADPQRTEVRVEQGKANASVNVVSHDHLLLVDMQNGQTQLLSHGLYTFNAATNTMRVYNGEAYLFPGSDTNSDVKPVKVKEEHEVILGGDKAKPEKFDREVADDDLLPWTGPKEAQAALADNSTRRGTQSYSDDGTGYASYYPAYGFAGAYSPYYDGFGYPYGGWGPYGFYGYPFFGIGFGYFGGGGFYNGEGYRNYPPIKGPGRFGGTVRGGSVGRGFTSRGASPSFGGGRGFAGGHSFGGGSRGGGGHR